MTATRVAVYTAIFGGYEATAQPLPADLHKVATAHLFTDSDEIFDQARAVGWHGVWTKHAYGLFEPNPANGDPAITRPMLAHKWYKTHPVAAMESAWMSNPEGMPDVSIWLDGNMRIKVGGVEFVERCLAALGPDDWSAMRHPWRNCIYTEAEYTATVCAWRYDAAAIRRQAAAYEAAGYPRGAGLQATGFMVRRHTPLVEAIGEAWWQENLTWSHQDQISLPFVLGHARDNGATAFLDRGFGYNEDLPWGELWDLLPHGS